MTDEKTNSDEILILQAKTLRGAFLTYTLKASDLTTKEGVHYFTDPKTGQPLQFAVANCEVRGVAK